MSEPNAKRRIRHYDPSYLQFGFISSPDVGQPIEYFTEIRSLFE